MSKLVLTYGIACLLIFNYQAQDTDEQLANYYYGIGDCEKALPYLEKVYENNSSKFLFNRLIDCSRNQRSDKDIIKLFKNQISIYPFEYDYQVMLGMEYEAQNDIKNANKTYDQLIEDMQPYHSEIVKVQKAFSVQGKHDLALKVLEKGRSVIIGNYPLNIQFAEVYGDLGRTEEMIDEYIGLIDYQSSMLATIQRVMPRMVNFEDDQSESFVYLKNSLLKRIQKDPNNVAYTDMLIWTYVQNKNFEGAFIQAKALDKRISKDGREVFELAELAASNQSFEVARKAFKYVVELGMDFPYYYSAEKALLNTRYVEITTSRNYTQQQILETTAEYEVVLNRIGSNGNAIPILLELANIKAFYANDAAGAKTLLETGLTYSPISDMNKAKLNMALADVLVVLNEIWEASLLYMQVENEFKFDPIGFEAKFKNARVFYYSGDFIWAQAQLDVLKASTSKLIANDAMKLSIFITSHLGLDSNLVVMTKFARADLLLEQHRFEEAFVVFDSIQRQFPYHGIMDDLLMRKARAFEYSGQWEKALEMYENVLEKFSSEIMADDAVFGIANIYDYRLNNSEKAKEYYFKLLKEYRDSLHVTEARKRYRLLNGES